MQMQTPKQWEYQKTLCFVKISMFYIFGLCEILIIFSHKMCTMIRKNLPFSNETNQTQFSGICSYTHVPTFGPDVNVSLVDRRRDDLEFAFSLAYSTLIRNFNLGNEKTTTRRDQVSTMLASWFFIVIGWDQLS